ncbi:MAG: hypothetical protein KIH00_05990 [Lachnospiraceae bacterium]|nr:hypothetical protein [Lachnospiraceae bacterium]
MEKKETAIIAYEKHREWKRRLLAALLSFAGVCALSRMLKTGGDAIAFTNSIFSVLTFLALYLLMEKILKASFRGKKRRWILPGLFGTAFSFCMITGVQLDTRGSVPFSDPSLWLAILAGAVVMTLSVRYFWDLIDGKQRERAVSRQKEGEATDQGEKRWNKFSGWLLPSALIFVMYLPVFLAVYPGFFVYDAQDELMQVVTRSFSTHHPLVHVLMLGGIIQLVHKLTGSYNAGIACYTVFQMLVMAGIFGWCIRKLEKWGVGKGYRILTTLYFGLCPVLVMFSLCSAKDGLFAGMLLIMTILLTELFKAPEEFWKQKGKLLLLLAASLGMMLLRHNGFYAFAVFSVLTVIYLKKDRKKAALYFGGILATYLVVSAGLTGILRADASENQEMLTVPISQMTRVYQNRKEELPSEEKELLYQYLPQEALEHYTPKVSDGVKVHFNNQAYEADRGSFLKLWLKWGTENPFTYLNAWFMTSYGFWYPDTVIDVYRGNTVFTYTYEDSSYFGYEVEQPGTRQSKLPWLSEIYRRMSLEIFQQRIPVVSMLFSPGFLFWMSAFILCFWGYHGRWKKVMALMPVMLCWLTVLLGPTYLTRYVVYLWAVLPVILAEFDNCRHL